MIATTLKDIAQSLGLEWEGDGTVLITGVASLDNATSGDIAFLGSVCKRTDVGKCSASALIVHPDHRELFPGNKLLSSNPKADFARTILLLRPVQSPQGIHETAIVDPSAVLEHAVYVGPFAVIEHDVRIGEGTIVESNCVIGAGSRLGAQCHLKAGVKIADGVRIGHGVLIHQGAVVGADGFGLAKEGDAWLKVAQIGGVVIGDNVEIGANTTIDRGAIDDTVIEHGVKLDNQIQIAHNVRIGANTAIAACVGIAGSARIGKGCTIGGAAVVLGHLEIVDNVHITAMSLVTKSIEEPGTYSSGTPLQKNAVWHRNYVRFKQLDKMAKRLKALEDELKALRTR